MAEQREGRGGRTAVLVFIGLAVLLVGTFFLVPRKPPSVAPGGRGEPTVCRLTRGDESITRLLPGAPPFEARAGDVVRCTVAPSFREILEVWAQQGDAPPAQISSQSVSGKIDLPGLELPQGTTRIFLVRSDRPPTPEAVREAVREGGRTPRLRVESYAIIAR